MKTTEPIIIDSEPTSAHSPQSLGDTAVKIVSYEQSIQADVEVAGSEPLHFAPAGAKPYIGEAKVGLELLGSAAQEKAIEYSSSLFPERSFSYVGSGRYGIVLSDEQGKAYKIYRNSLQYSRVEQEAGALQILAEAGLGPRLHALVDTGSEYRLDRNVHDYTTFGFEDVVIPRIDTDRQLPVLIMDYVDTAPLESAAPQVFIDGFCETAALFIKEGIYCWDAEFGVDKATDKVTLLDAGGLYQRSAKQQPHTPHEDTAGIIENLCLDFGILNHSRGIDQAYTSNGIAGIRAYLEKMKNC